MTSLPHFHFDLPQNDVHYHIEPFFSVTEEEVKENKKNLMMELEWFTRYANQMRKIQVPHIYFKQIMWHPSERQSWIKHMEQLRMMPDMRGSYVRRILQCNEYVASLPAPRIQFVTIKRKPRFQRKSWLGRCFAWLDAWLSGGILFQKVLVNLQTKEVVLCTYYSK